MKTIPDLSYEKRLWRSGFAVVGVDEVGRGSLAGPLLVGGVCFPTDVHYLKTGEKGKKIAINEIGINDSKKLSSFQRNRLEKIIKANACAWSTSSISVSEINRKGIVAATHKAMRRVVNNIKKQLDPGLKIFVLIDAFNVKYMKGVGLKNQQAVIKGDSKIMTIAAASIIAKVERDRLMEKLSAKYPIYCWNKNKGYGTGQHIKAIRKYGPVVFHRRLYLQKILINK